MEIRAYSQDYLNDAQCCLGDAFDYGIVTLGYGPEKITTFLLNSDVSKQIERGNPKYVSGMNGCEVMRLMLEQCGIKRNDPDALYVDKTPEYWAGWSLAFYQWYSVRTFEDILTAVPLKQIINMYDIYHEMDLMQFADAMDEVIQRVRSEGNLARLRMNHNMTETELSEESGISERDIRSFEKGRLDINRASGITLFRLSKALDCSMEDLIERGKRLQNGI